MADASPTELNSEPNRTNLSVSNMKLTTKRNGKLMGPLLKNEKRSNNNKKYKQTKMNE